MVLGIPGLGRPKIVLLCSRSAVVFGKVLQARHPPSDIQKWLTSVSCPSNCTSRNLPSMWRRMEEWLQLAFELRRSILTLSMTGMNRMSRAMLSLVLLADGRWVWQIADKLIGNNDKVTYVVTCWQEPSIEHLYRRNDMLVGLGSLYGRPLD